jgi:hypothetical protein
MQDRVDVSTVMLPEREHVGYEGAKREMYHKHQSLHTFTNPRNILHDLGTLREPYKDSSYIIWLDS